MARIRVMIILQTMKKLINMIIVNSIRVEGKPIVLPVTAIILNLLGQ